MLAAMEDLNNIKQNLTRKQNVLQCVENANVTYETKKLKVHPCETYRIPSNVSTYRERKREKKEILVCSVINP